MSSIGAVGRNFLTTASRQTYLAQSCLEAINEKFSKLKIHVADFKSTRQFNTSSSKINVLLSEEILAAAGGDEAVSVQLEKRLKALPDVAKALSARFEDDITQDLKSFGFTVDKNGDIYCRGTARKKDGDADIRFDIKLGNLKEKSSSLVSRLEREFDKQAFRLNILV